MSADPHDTLCAECGRRPSADERGRKAYLTTDEQEPTEAVVYCPECAERVRRGRPISPALGSELESSDGGWANEHHRIATRV